MLPGVCPQITQIDPDSHRNTTQRRKDAKAQSPEETRRGGGAETQRGAEATRSSGENSTAHGGRVSLSRTAVPNAGVRPSSSTQRPALSESAGLASQTELGPIGTRTITFEYGKPRRHRRTGGASAGGSPTETNAGVRSGWAFHRYPAIVRSPVFPPHHSGQHPKRRKRPFASLRWFCPVWSFSVSLCLCGSPGAMDLRHLRDLRAVFAASRLCVELRGSYPQPRCYSPVAIRAR